MSIFYDLIRFNMLSILYNNILGFLSINYL
jgi:hypothetical protein